ncbi:hypothetical protein ACFLVN_05495 [Chloroflexota bacterium]
MKKARHDFGGVSPLIIRQWMIHKAAVATKEVEIKESKSVLLSILAAATSLFYMYTVCFGQFWA